MKKQRPFIFTLIILFCMLCSNSSFAQTSTEVFETESNNSTSFTDNGVIFNIISKVGTFDVQTNYPSTGWNGSSGDNRYIDNTGSAVASASFSIKTTSNLFKLNRFWMFLSDSNLDLTVSGTITVTGKLSGVTKFTQTKTSGFTTSLSTTRGFTLIDLTSLNGQNYSNIIIDELEITLGGAYQYASLDAFTWIKVVPAVPTATLTVADNVLKIGETSLVTITFNEAVTGFTNADLTIANGTLSAVSSLDNITWTATFTPSASITAATNFITLNNTGVQNGGGNAGSGTTNSNNYAIDTQRPTATIVVADNALRIGETSLVTITFSEAVTGFTLADLTVSNGTLSGLSTSDNIIYTATFTPSASINDATNLITLDNTGVQDGSGNNGSGTTDSNNYAIDTQRPTATIVVADPTLIVAETSLITITFSEAVSGFTNADLAIANGTLTAVSSSDGGITYTATFTPTVGISDAINVISLANAGVLDNAGNAGIGITNSANYTINTVSLSATTNQTNVSCNGGSNGTASVTASGGTGPYTYMWAPTGGTAANASGLSAGTYTCTIRDANGTEIDKNITITEPSALIATAGAQTNVSCNGGTNGSATVNVTGGTGSYTYSWTPSGGTGATASGLAAGTYTVTIKDANLCQTTQSFTITQPSVLSSTPSQTNVLCYGGASGTASVSVSGGSGSYTYVWSPSGGTAATATGLTVGNYSVLITDANGCTATRNFTINQPASLTATTSQANATCVTLGQASVSVSGGSGPYTYIWSPSGGTSATATGLTAGNYSVIVIDANGCTLSRNFTITTTNTLTATQSKTDVLCNGTNTGTATVVPSGAPGPYTYVWAPSGGSAATATGLSAGNYSVTITSSNGCSIVKNFTISQPSAITTTSSQTNVSCNGGANGSASVTPSGGTGAYTYSWSPSGGTAATATGLTAGSYTVTITDANLCQTTKDFTITEPSVINTATGSQTNVSCNGGTNGSASVSPSGGIPGYTYSWSPSGGTAATATGLAAGSYTVTITDANGCTATRNYTITQPGSPLVATAASQTNINCRGDFSGSATVNVTGGTGAYTYSWSPSGGTGATATGLSAGTYTVTVKDANLCQTTQSFTITQPAAVLSATTASTGVSCFGGTNGSASVTVSGGTSGYTYLWAPLGGTGATITGRPAGNYTCTITDSKGCTLVKNITINTPNAISTATGSQTNISCNGGTNGSASVTPSGGTPGYTYSWSPSGGTAATATGLAAGSYMVTITDANGCTATRNYTITEPNAITAIPSQTNVSCNGGTNGSATVTPSGGTGSYTYSWAPTGGTAATATGLAAGSYTVTIRDANLCQTTQNFTITQPTLVNLTGMVLNGGAVAVNYLQTISATGASGVYTYSSSGILPPGITLATNGVLSGSPTTAGSYNFTVVATDNSCSGNTATASFSINVIKGSQSITFGTIATKTYGDANFTLGAAQTSSGLTVTYVATDPTVVTITGNTAHILKAGSTMITASQIGSPNYNDVTVQQSLTIDKKLITVTAEAKSKVYGATDPVFNYTPNPALVTGDSFSGSLSRAIGENIGTYAITQGTLSAGANYTISYVGANLTITKKTVTVTADVQSKVYGEVDPSLTYTAMGLIGGNVLNGDLNRAPGEDIGTYSIGQGSLTASANYTILFLPADLSITVKPLTILAQTKTKEYGTVDPLLTYTATGLVSGDVLSGSLNRAAGESVGSYSINQGTLSASANYAVAYIAANLSITKKIITVKAETKTKVYGEADPNLTYTTTGLIAGDAITGSLNRVAGENFGSYTINQGTLSASVNYTLNYQSASLNITKKPIAITINAKSKTYGDADPALTYTFLPALVAGDAFTGALTRASGENAGDYPITQGSLTAGSNYAYNLQPAVLSINKANLTITANNSQLCIGSTFPVFTVSYNGFKNGDDQNSLLGKPVVGTSAGSGSPAGTYALKPGGANANNYSFNYVDGMLTINALPQVTISSNNGNSISKGETLILTASGGTSYSWTNANGVVSGQNTATLTIRPSQTTTYTVTVVNASGCSQSQTFTVTVRDDFQVVVATNLLSPNGDGINDNWIIKNIDMYPNNEVKVFDKAGRVVYSKRGYDNSWNGTLNGLPLAENTYYYIVDFGAGKLKQKGFITIIQQK